MRRERLTPDERHEQRTEVGFRSAEVRWRDHTKKSPPWPAPRPGPKSTEWWEWVKEIGASPHDRLALEHLDLSVRTLNALELVNVTTIGDLTALTASQVTDVAKLGAPALEEIKTALRKWNKRLARQRKPEPLKVVSDAVPAEADPQITPITPATDYPRIMFHPSWAPIVVHSREQENALSPKWSRQYLRLPPAPAPPSAPPPRTAPVPPKAATAVAKTTPSMLTPSMITNELLSRFKDNLGFSVPAPPKSDPADYPRMMFHRYASPVTVQSRAEEDALGPEWTRTYVPRPPKPPPPPEPRDPSLPQPWEPIKAQPKQKQPAKPAETWQELWVRLGH